MDFWQFCQKYGKGVGRAMDDIDRRGLIAENEQQLAKLKRDLERRKIEQIWEQPLERKDGGAGLIYKTRGR